jgi:probable F420-dependent oxidoreductase
MNISAPGVFVYTDSLTAVALKELARKAERLGYSALWFPEVFGRDPFTLASYLLSHTERLVLATGIANVWKREAVTMMGAARTLAEAFPDRFILGIGISHGPLMAQFGINYAKPLVYMREHLRKLKSVPYGAPVPVSDPPVMIAALLPKMLKLAATESRGTIPVFITPEHTARIHSVIGPDKWICLAQAVMPQPNAAKARSAARRLIAFYIAMPNYRQSLASIGFQDADFAGGGSDRLVDAMVAWGDAKQIRERIAAHYKAGATHVSLILVDSNAISSWERDNVNSWERALPDERALEALAPN